MMENFDYLYNTIRLESRVANWNQLFLKYESKCTSQERNINQLPPFDIQDENSNPVPSFGSPEVFESGKNVLQSLITGNLFQDGKRTIYSKKPNPVQVYRKKVTNIQNQCSSKEIKNVKMKKICQNNKRYLSKTKKISTGQNFMLKDKNNKSIPPLRKVWMKDNELTSCITSQKVNKNGSLKMKTIGNKNLRKNSKSLKIESKGCRKMKSVEDIKLKEGQNYKHEFNRKMNNNPYNLRQKKYQKEINLEAPVIERKIRFNNKEEVKNCKETLNHSNYKLSEPSQEMKLKRKIELGKQRLKLKKRDKGLNNITKKINSDKLIIKKEAKWKVSIMKKKLKQNKSDNKFVNCVLGETKNDWEISCESNERLVHKPDKTEEGKGKKINTIVLRKKNEPNTKSKKDLSLITKNKKPKKSKNLVETPSPKCLRTLKRKDEIKEASYKVNKVNSYPTSRSSKFISTLRQKDDFNSDIDVLYKSEIQSNKNAVKGSRTKAAIKRKSLDHHSDIFNENKVLLNESITGKLENDGENTYQDNKLKTDTKKEISNILKSGFLNSNIEDEIEIKRISEITSPVLVNSFFRNCPGSNYNDLSKMDNDGDKKISRRLKRKKNCNFCECQKFQSESSSTNRNSNKSNFSSKTNFSTSTKTSLLRIFNNADETTCGNNFTNISEENVVQNDGDKMISLRLRVSNKAEPNNINTTSLKNEARISNRKRILRDCEVSKEFKTNFVKECDSRVRSKSKTNFVNEPSSSMNTFLKNDCQYENKSVSKPTERDLKYFGNNDSDIENKLKFNVGKVSGFSKTMETISSPTVQFKAANTFINNYPKKTSYSEIWNPDKKNKTALTLTDKGNKFDFCANKRLKLNDDYDILEKRIKASTLNESLSDYFVSKSQIKHRKFNSYNCNSWLAYKMKNIKRTSDHPKEKWNSFSFHNDLDENELRHFSFFETPISTSYLQYLD